MALQVAPVVPNTSNTGFGAFNLSITAQDCDGDGQGACSSDQNAVQPAQARKLISTASLKAASDSASKCTDLSYNKSSISCSLSSYRAKLPILLEENESPSAGEGSSVWTASSFPSSSSSTTISSSSSSRAFFRRGSSKMKHWFFKAKDSGKRSKKRSEGKVVPFIPLLLQPLKTLRDGYMSCLIRFDEAGDLSGLAQGSVFASSCKYFPDEPISKRDAMNYG